MKYYGVRRKKLLEKVAYTKEKVRCFCSQYTTFDKKDRQYRKQRYTTQFVSPYHFRVRSNAIQDGKYYTPICVITSDLVLRENIPQLQSGLANLLKKHLSHKFLGCERPIDEVLKSVENMDDTLTTWFSSIRVGRFDFEGISPLQNCISFFDVFIKNANSSYLLLEFHLYLTDTYVHEQTHIINCNYSNTIGYISPGFTRNKKISGGKQSYGVCHYNDADLKSDLLYENVTTLKWKFYQQFQNFCPTVLHQKNVCPPSINVYKTNIHYQEKGLREFWDSVGVSEFYGQFIDDSRKLFFRTALSGRYEQTDCSDLIYIVNDKTLERQAGYYSIDYQIIDDFSSSTSTALFKFMILNVLNRTVATTLIQYKSKLNRIKLKRNRLSEILKLRYFYEKDIDFYKRYIRDDIWETAKKQIERTLRSKTGCSYDHRILTSSAVASKDKISSQMEILRAEFEDKTSILQHLATYKREHRSDVMNFIMLVLATLTLIFVIFPNLSDDVASLLLHLASLTEKILKEIISFFAQK